MLPKAFMATATKILDNYLLTIKTFNVMAAKKVVPVKPAVKPMKKGGKAKKC